MVYKIVSTNFLSPSLKLRTVPFGKSAAIQVLRVDEQELRYSALKKLPRPFALLPLKNQEFRKTESSEFPEFEKPNVQRVLRSVENQESLQVTYFPLLMILKRLNDVE